MNKNIPINKISSIITHDGKFHADEVCAIAFLNIVANKDINVIRTFHPEEFESFDTITIDIGGGKFDHHEKYEDKERRFSKFRKFGAPYAAFGKVVKEYGNIIMTNEEIIMFDREFVLPIDLFDNGESNRGNEFSLAISSLNPVWDDNTTDIDDAFHQAINIAKIFIERKIEYCKSKCRAAVAIEQYTENIVNDILTLPSYIPWSKIVNDHKNIKFIIMPSEREGGYYKAVAVPIAPPAAPYRMRFPQEWTDLESEESIENGIKFCHSGRHMAVFDSYEHALTACTKLTTSKRY